MLRAASAFVDAAGADEDSHLHARRATARLLPPLRAQRRTPFRTTITTPPTLGNYPNTVVQLSENTTITPSAAPTNTTRMTVSTFTGFQGRLEGDPISGVV